MVGNVWVWSNLSHPIGSVEMNSSFYATLKARNQLKEAIALLDAELLAELPTWKAKAYHGFRYEAIRQLSKEGSISLVEAKKIVVDFEDWLRTEGDEWL